MDYNDLMELLKDERDYAIENHIPIIRDESARLLYDFVKDNAIKNVLEIGTAIGYSGSIILGAGAKRLTTIDINENYLEVAGRTFEKLGYSGFVEVFNGDAKEVLSNLVDEGRVFDLVFLDGAKGQYINYLPCLVKMIGKIGVIFADNVLLQGMVESNDKIPHKKRTMVVNLRKYLDMVNSGNFETGLIRLEDGIAITKYRGE